MWEKLETMCYKNDSGNWIHKTLCKCSCGYEKWLYTHNIKGSSMCKACKHKEYEEKSVGGYKHPTHHRWQSMINRCHVGETQHFAHYGGRGITVCDRWRGERPNGEVSTMDGFHAFLADMGQPAEGMSIDRIDNDKGYSPDNCRWATKSQQQNNKRTNVRVVALGRDMTVTEWTRFLGCRPEWAQAASKYKVPLPVAVGKLVEAKPGQKWQAIYGINRKPSGLVTPREPSAPVTDELYHELRILAGLD